MNSKTFRTLLGSALVAIVAFSFSSCSQNKKVSASYATMNMESVVLGNGADGMVTIKAWGSGANRSQAVDNAVKHALSDVIFKGFTHGTGVGSAGIRKLIYDVNAQQKYAYYFNPFFSQGGEYLQYAWEDTSNKKSVTKTGNEGRVGMAVMVIVNRPALEQKLIADGIIKP